MNRMNRLIRIASTAPDAESIRVLFTALDYMVAPFDDTNNANNDGTVAMVLGMDEQGDGAIARVKAIRNSGFRGAILVLGTAWPTLSVRQALAEAKAWFLPAMAGPADAVDRVNYLLARGE